MRPLLPETKIHQIAKQSMEGFHNSTVQECMAAVESNEWVVIGMAQNVVVKKARQYLEERSISYKYLEYGSYFSNWRRRLAIKLWTGWPTFPQIFHKGVLVGGFSDLKKYQQ